MNDILTRLRNGESVNDIANEFTEALNQAIKVREEEERAAKSKEATKENEFLAIYDMFVEWLIKYNPEVDFEEFKGKGAVFYSFFDNCLPVFVELDHNFLTPSQRPCARRSSSAIDDFLRANKLL